MGSIGSKEMEIERKYLVTSHLFAQTATRISRIKQGYLSWSDTTSVRIRLVDNTLALLTIKGPNDPTGLCREEYEYNIPLADAPKLLDLCPHRIIDKVRYEVPYAGLIWEVDVFGGSLDGLIIAEIELDQIDQEINSPPWIGRELTGNPHYYNTALSMNGLPPDFHPNSLVT